MEINVVFRHVIKNHRACEIISLDDEYMIRLEGRGGREYFAYRNSDCLPFRMLLRLATICYYTDLSFDEDVLSDDILKLIYEEELFERITGAKEHTSLINMTQYNEMLAEISEKVKQAWDAQNDARMARMMVQTKEQGAE